VPPSLFHNGSFTISTTAGGAWAGTRGLSGPADDDTHDDFKPQLKPAAKDLDPQVAEQIRQDVHSHDVFLYMKGVPAQPMCGFSMNACRLLDLYGEWLAAALCRGEDMQGACLSVWRSHDTHRCEVWCPQRAGGPPHP
jgi:hypothetical protein